MLRVHLAREHDTDLARYGWSQLLIAVGAKFAFTDDPQPTIYYGSDWQLGRAAAIWIPPDDFMAAPPPATANSAPPEFDLARAAAYWLTLESEKETSSRDEHGRVPGPDSLLGRIGALNTPPIEDYSKQLIRRFRDSGVRNSVIPRWPQGRTYAVALTHDVDQPERAESTLSYVRRTLRSDGLRRSYWALAAEIRAHGLLGAVCDFPTRRREWDFDEICEFEASLGLRSAFYFSTIHRSNGHALDVQYDLTARRYRSLLRRLNDGDWEIGLHAAYGTHHCRPHLQEQLESMQRRTSARLSGVRHHYLLVDPSDPIRSLRDHAAEGLIYDTSLGFNRIPGFRCGIALPFQPYHPSTGPLSNFVELPMTLADMHLPTRDPQAAVETVKAHLQTVRSFGGLAVLNWHVGHWHSTPAWRESYIAACHAIAEDSEAWVATPHRIALWWLDRTAALTA